MTKVTQVGGPIPQRPSAGYPDKIIKDHLLSDQPAHSFFHFFLFCFEMSVLWAAILILFHSV